MKKQAVILFFMFTAAFSFAGNPLLRKAEEAYDARRYQEAINAYQKLVNSGYASYELYYNLGNSYYRNNELGYAIYYYELARKLQPNDEDVRINLAIASSKTIDKIDAKENFFISAVKSNLLSTFSTAAWAWLTIIAVALMCIFIFLFVSAAAVALKRFSLVASAFFFVAFIVCYGLGYSAFNSKVDNKFAIITARETRIMNEPTGTASGKFSLHEGTRVKVVRRNGDWLLIRLDNGNEGWLHAADVGII